MTVARRRHGAPSGARSPRWRPARARPCRGGPSRGVVPPPPWARVAIVTA